MCRVHRKAALGVLRTFNANSYAQMHTYNRRSQQSTPDVFARAIVSAFLEGYDRALGLLLQRK